MESPNQYLSPEPSLARIAPTSFEIQGSKVCSTIRPLTLRHCFGWFQRKPCMESPNQYLSPEPSFARIAPTSFEIQGSKVCSTIRPSLCATVLVGLKGTMYGKPQPVPFTRTFFCQDCSNQFRDPRVQSVLGYPPPHSATLFWLVSRKPCMESPNRYLSPEPSFARIAPTSFEIQGSKVCSTIRPSLCATALVGFKGTSMESPYQYLSPEPSFARIAPTSFEIQGSKVCSTIRPLTLRHYFGWFQGNHVWKAPTSTFHQNLL